MKEISISPKPHMTPQTPKKTAVRKQKVAPASTQENKTQSVSTLKVPQKRTKKVIESVDETKVIKNMVASVEQTGEDATTSEQPHKIHHRIHKGLSQTGSAWQRVKKLLFSTPALALFSLMMGLSLWSDYQNENVQLSASIQNISEQITTQGGSGYSVSPDISLVSGIPNSDIVDFVFNKNARDVKEIRYSLVYDQKKLQFGENLSHFEGCSIDTQQINPLLLSVKLACNKSQDFRKDIPIISHTITHINDSKDVVINVVNIEFTTKDGSVYELAGKSKVY